MLSPWAQDAKDHWKRHRPKMYADLEKAGTLDQQAEKTAENARNEFHLSVENGMDPHEAWSSARQNHLFPPDEEDQPHLGESPVSSQDPTNLQALPHHRPNRSARGFSPLSALTSESSG
jgi:hypothetical protein